MQFLTTALEFLSEAKDSDAAKVRSMLVSLSSPGARDYLFQEADYGTALGDFLEILPDVKMDAPLADKHVAALLGRLLHVGAISREVLESASAPLRDIDGDFASSLNKLIDAAEADAAADAPAADSGEGGGSGIGNSTGGVGGSGGSDSFADLVRSRASGDDLLQFLDTSAGSAEDPAFVREAVEVLLDHGLGNLGDGSPEEDERDAVKKHTRVLTRLLQSGDKDKQAELQVSALMGVVSLSASRGHPRDLAKKLFAALYDENIVQEDAYDAWKKRGEDAGEGFAEVLAEVSIVCSRARVGDETWALPRRELCAARKTPHTQTSEWLDWLENAVEKPLEPEEVEG